MADKKVGTISHYYDKLGVAVINVTAKFSIGDTIKITGKSADFTQEVNSMESDHKKITQANKGKVVGLKVDQLVRKGDEVFKVK